MTADRPGLRSDAGGGHISTSQQIGVINYPVRPEDWFALRHADWNRLRSRVASLANPLPYIGQVGWACVGVGASSLVALLPWLPAYAQLPVSAHNHYAWVTPTLVVLGGGCLVIAAICRFANKVMHDRDAATVKDVLTDMDACYTQHQTSDAGKLVNDQIQLREATSKVLADALASGKMSEPYYKFLVSTSRLAEQGDRERAMPVGDDNDEKN